MLSARLFSRAVGFRTLLLAASKDATGGSAKPTTIPELTARIGELEADVKTLTDEKATAATAQADLQAKLEKAETEKADLQAKLTAAESAKADLQGKLTAAETAKTDFQAKITTAETAKTSAETAKTAAESEAAIAKTKANECAAKAGLKAPYTSAVKEEGQKQSGDDSAKTPRERLAATMKVAGYEQD